MRKLKDFASLYRVPIILFFVALAPRLLYVLWMDPGNISPDGFVWMDIARDLAAGNGYGDNWRSPIYSYFLAALFYFKPDGLLLVRIAQSVVGALTALNVYYIGKSIFNKRAGILAGLLLAVYPYLIYYCGDILKETLFTFLITLTVASLLLAREKPGAAWKIAAGVISGITVLCKSTVLPFMALASIWHIFIARRGSFPESARGFGIVLLFMGLTISPWTYRNYLEYHRFVLVETRGAEHFWLANNPVAARFENIPHLDVERLPDKYAVWCDTAAYQRILDTQPPAEADRTFFREAVAFIVRDKPAYLRLMALRLLHFWRLSPRVATRTNKLIALATSGWMIPLGFLGMALSWRAYWRSTSLLIMLIFSFTAVHIMFWAMIRYRVPIDPFVIIFAGFSIDVFLNKFHPARSGPDAGSN